MNWHHEVVCEYLDKFARREITRLILSMPPRHTKSEFVSRRLPAFILGQNPNAPIIAASYGADLARRMNRDVQRIIDSAGYARLFPNTRLSGTNVRTVAQGTWLRNSDMFEVVEYNGYYRGTGIGGAITGMGMLYGIIDDPIKNRQEANSETVRQSIWEWYTSTFRTRLAPGGAILITMTRWHEDDLVGRLIALAKSDPQADQWVVVSLPAIAEWDEAEGKPEYERRERGEPLWPQRFDMEELTRIQHLNAQDWSSLYQQRPSPAEGGLLNRMWWRFWVPKGTNYPPVLTRKADGSMHEHIQIELPDSFEEQIQSWDMTFKDTKTSDFVAGQVWGRVGANRYLLDQKMERLDIVGSIRAVTAMTAKWPDTHAKLIEDKANGPAIIAMLRDKIPGLIAFDPKSSKEARVSAVAPTIEAGNVYLPHPHVAPWVNGLIDRATAFPNAAHDDDIDALSQALLRWQGRNTVLVAAV